MRALLYVWSAYLFVTASWAWSPFSDQPDMQETRLSAQDLTRIQINAGWAKGDDRTLLFEVKNSLKGPIQCSGVQVDLKDGKNLYSRYPGLFIDRLDLGRCHERRLFDDDVLSVAGNDVEAVLKVHA